MRFAEALNKTILLFPFYRSVLRRGVFWQYFEDTDIMPEVEEETNPLWNAITLTERIFCLRLPIIRIGLT